MSILKELLEGLTVNECTENSVDYDATPYDLDQVSYIVSLSS